MPRNQSEKRLPTLSKVIHAMPSSVPTELYPVFDADLSYCLARGKTAKIVRESVTPVCSPAGDDLICGDVEDAWDAWIVDNPQDHRDILADLLEAYDAKKQK